MSEPNGDPKSPLYWRDRCQVAEMSAQKMRERFRGAEAEIAALETMIERAIAAADWEPGDAQRALRELRDSYDTPGQKQERG